MSMDGLSLYSAMNELNKRLAGGKIDKIQQTDKEELLLMVRSLGQTYRLLINASAADNRVQLTELKKQAPSEAPMFCMLLRKRIAGGKIVRFEQERLDRVLKISIETYNDLGDLSVFALYCELMGKHSNIILVNEKGVIVDAIKHVGLGMSSVRFVMPGLEYSAPPAQDKQDPSKASADDFSMAMCMVGMSIAKALSNAFFGLSPAVAAQLVARYTDKTECTQLSEAEREELASRLAAFYADIAQGKEKASAVLNALGETEAVYPFAIAGGGIKLYDSIGEALDSLYINSDRREWAKRHGASSRKVLQNNIERCEKKLALYADALNSGEQMEKCRLYGELLTDKQREYYDLHYNQDLSLAEIAASSGISRQGVWDNIRRADAALRDTEARLGLVRRFAAQRAAAAALEDTLTKLRDTVGGDARPLAELALRQLQDLKG